MELNSGTKLPFLGQNYLWTFPPFFLAVLVSRQSFFSASTLSSSQAMGLMRD